MDLIARAVTEDELRSAELLFDRLDLPELALARIAELSGVPESAFVREGGWAAMLELDGSSVLASSDGERWSFSCPANHDEAEAMLCARTLHGRIASQSEDWDLDR